MRTTLATAALLTCAVFNGSASVVRSTLRGFALTGTSPEQDIGILFIAGSVG